MTNPEAEKQYIWVIRGINVLSVKKVELAKETDQFFFFSKRDGDTGYVQRQQKKYFTFYRSEAEANLARIARLKSSLEHHRKEVKRLEELLGDQA